MSVRGLKGGGPFNPMNCDAPNMCHMRKNHRPKEHAHVNIEQECWLV